MLRLVARDGAIVPDQNATLPGRGAWVHRDRDCVEAAIRRRAFGRALRVDAELDASALADVRTGSTVLPTEQADPPMDN